MTAWLLNLTFDTVGVGGLAGEGDLEIPQVAEVLNFEAFELHQSASISFITAFSGSMIQPLAISVLSCW
jgi:hypothetical protein